MKATTKKLITAIFVLAVAIALAASSTYAWFAMSTTPDIREFEVDVTAGESILIAVTEVGIAAPVQGLFKSYISTDEITGTSGVGQFYDLDGVAIDPQTNVKLGLATADGNLEFDIATGVTSSLLTGEGAYYAFDVHFIGSQAFNIYLNDGTEVKSNAASATNPFPATVWAALNSASDKPTNFPALNDPIAAEAANAVRIAFQTVEYVAEEGSNPEVQAAYNVYEPNAGKSTGDYEVGYRFGSYGGTNDMDSWDTIENLALAYYNYMNDATLTAPAAPFTPFVDAAFGATALVGLSDTDVPASIGASDIYYGKFTVKIWLEGWDADALDSIKAQTLATTLKFIGAIA